MNMMRLISAGLIVAVVSLFVGCGGQKAADSLGGGAGSPSAQMDIVSFTSSTVVVAPGAGVNFQWSASGQSYNGTYSAKIYVDSVDDAVTKTAPTGFHKIYDASCAFTGTAMASLFQCGSSATVDCGYTYGQLSGYSLFSCSMGTAIPQTINAPVTGAAYVIFQICGMDGNTYQDVCAYKSIPITLN